MKCLYYLSPSLGMSENISRDLREIGINDWYVHIISKDESGLAQKHLRSGNYLEKLDIVRSGTIGAAIGFCVAIIAIFLLSSFKPFGPNIPTFVYLMLLFVITMFGAWEGGLFGVEKENRKLTQFHNDIEAGKCLVLIYALKSQEKKIKEMMRMKHQHSELAAIDKHFINPFSNLSKVHKLSDKPI